MNKRHFWTRLRTSQTSAQQTLSSAMRVLHALVLVAVVGGMYLASSIAPLTGGLTPVAAGTTEPGIPLFTETFSNQDATASGINLLNYTGDDAMTYDADAPYLPSGGQCNGWVMNSSTPRPTAAQDAGCDNNAPAGWGQLQKMATALGLAQGQDAATAAANQVLTEYTNATNGAIAAGYELKTKSSITAKPGHYYAVSAYFAEVNCFAAHAKMTFSLVVNGTPTVLSTGLDPCAAATGPIVSGTRVAKLQSAAIQMPSTGTPTLGLQLRNETTDGQGNDVSFDLPQIVDVTPSLDKAFSPSTIVQGETSTLTFTITNTDDLAAKTDWNFTDALPAGMTLADNSFGGTCAQVTGDPFTKSGTGGKTITVSGGDLAAGDTSCTIIATVTTDAPGPYVNGPANVTTPLLPPEDTLLVVIPPVAKLALDKRVVSPDGVVDVNDNDLTDAGDTIAYEFEVTNTGNVTLTDVNVTDPKLAAAGITIDCPVTALAPDASTVCTASGPYKITQADVDSGAVTNVATAHGTPPTGVTPPAEPTDTTVTPTDKTAAIDLVKTADKKTLVAGQTITYTFVATNTGNVSLSNVTIAEDTFTASGTMSPLTCAPIQPATLAPTAKVTCTATYVVTQADVDKGTITNTADVVGTPPTGPNVTDTDQVQVPGTRTAELALDKRVVSPDGVVDVNDNDLTDAGDTIAYEFEVTNTGNVTLTDVNVTDPKLAAAGITIDCPVTALAPDASTVCTASGPYKITQADVDSGAVTNVATAHGTPPTGVTPPAEPTDTTVTPTAQRPDATFDKRVEKTEDVNGNGYLDVDDEIYYEFLVANTGNVTLTDVVVSDDLLTANDITVACTPDVLAPGESVLCKASAPYKITAADVAAHVVLNSALVHVGVPPGVTPVNPPKDQTTTPVGEPVVGPVVGPTTGNNGGILPNTGMSTLVLIAGAAGLLLILAGAGTIRSAGRTRPRHVK